MQFVRISPTQILNLDHVTHVEIFLADEVRYMSVHFSNGESYRCDEEETEALVAALEKIVAK